MQVYTNGTVWASISSLSSSNTWSTNWTQSVAGFYTFVAVATDNDGYTNASAPVTVQVKRSTPNAAPVANIGSPIAPTNSLNGLTITNAYQVTDGQLALSGSAYDPDAGDPVFWQVVLLDPNHPDDAPLYNVTPGTLNAQGFRSGSVTNGSFGILDLSLVENGAYLLTLVVEGGGDKATASLLINVASNLKVGQFSFSEQDLVIPVNGIPLTVVRTYNSLNPRSADFGFGWSYALNSMDVQLDDERTNVTIGSASAPFADVEEDANGLPLVASVRTGGPWDVTLTLPDGRRTTFAFTPEVHLDLAIARWTGPPDVHATLSANPASSANIEFFPALHWQDGDNTVGLGTFDNHDLPGWVLQTLDGTQYYLTRGTLNTVYYDTSGNGNIVTVPTYGPPKLTSIVQRTGDTIVINPDSIAHYAPNATNATRSLFMERDEQNRITAIHDPISGSSGVASVRYVYNEDTGNLIQVLKLVDRAAGTYLTNKYHYDHPKFPHYITSIEDPRGLPVARNLYDDGGRLIGIIDVAGRTNRFEHNLTNRTETVYDRKGVAVMTYAYDLRGNVTNSVDVYGNQNRFTYDNGGALLSQTDPLNRTTTYSNDANGNVLSVTLPYPAGADAELYTTRYTYDTNANQTSLKLPTGGIITNIFDGAGRLAEIRDGSSNLISRTDYDAATSLAVAEIDHFGTNRFAYDATGNAIRFTNSLNQVIYSGYDLNGNLSALTNNAVASSFQYDAQSRETVSDYGQGITLSNSYQSQLDWNTVDGPTIGHMERRFDEQGRLGAWTTANGAKPSFAYDENGRLQYETNSLGVVSQYTYDLIGRVSAVTNLATSTGITYAYDAASQRVGATNALGQWTRYGYQPDGSLAAMTNALGKYWLYTNTTAGSCCGSSASSTVTDPLGRKLINNTSALGLPIETVRQVGSVSRTNKTTYVSGMTSPEQEAEEYPETITDEGGRTRRFAYAAVGQLQQATDLGGSVWWTNQYDVASGALSNVVSPTSETLSYTYDSLDNLKTVRFGDGYWLTNYYDSANRLSSNNLPSGARLTFAYDSAGRLTNRNSTVGESASFQYNLNDAVTLMTDNTGNTTNLYDSAGRLYGINYPSGATVRYDFDKLDRITNITMKASGGGTAYSTKYYYNPVGNLTNVLDPLGGKTVFEYDDVNRRTKRTLPNNVVTTYDYNDWDQLTNVVHKLGTNVLASFTYVRAAGGEPTRITREDGTYVDLQYDAALRLTNEVYYSSGGSPLTTNSYGYDASGSRVRLVKGGQTLTNNVSAGYRITAVKDAANGNTSESYAYDNGGRVTTITRDGATRNLGYNTADQLTAFTNGATWVTYVHDASGRRTISTNSAGAVRRFLMAQTPETDLESPLLVYNASGAIAQGYVYVGHQPLLRSDTGGNAVYYLEDAMGSVAALVDRYGTKVAWFNYDGFGNYRSVSGSTNAPTGTGGDFRFQGAWLETDSGLYNLRAREYDPRTARFVSRDPDVGEFEQPETLNPYGFANLNPLVYSDPSGETTMIEINIVTLIEDTLAVMRQVGVSYAKHRIKSAIFNAFINVASEQLAGLSPEYDALLKVLRAGDIQEAAGNFEKKILGAVCKVPTVRDAIYFESSINAKGDAIRDGLNCRQYAGKKKPANWFKKGAARPDFILSTTPPSELSGRGAIVVGEIKLSGNRLYKNYVKPGDKQKQLDAICNFAGKHVQTDTAVFLTVWRGNPSNFQALKRELLRKTISKHTLLILYSVQKK